MFQFVTVLAVGLLVLSISALIFTLQRNVVQPLSSQIAEMVITIIAFVFSAGYVRLAYRYQQFAAKAGRIDERAHHLLNQAPTEIEAILLLHDYQIARSSSPLLPSWLWKFREEELNQLWEKHNSSV